MANQSHNKWQPFRSQSAKVRRPHPRSDSDSIQIQYMSKKFKLFILAFHILYLHFTFLLFMALGSEQMTSIFSPQAYAP